MKPLLTSFVFLLFSSCMVGPNYERPYVDTPSKFTEEKEHTEEMASLQNWWYQFNDPKLNELIDIAVENNYDLQIAIEKIKEMRALYRIESANLWPEVDLKAAVIRSKSSHNLFGASFYQQDSTNLFQMGFDALWELDFLGKARRSKEAACYNVQAEQEKLRDIYVTLLSDVARNYVDIRALQEKIKIVKRKVFLYKQLYSLTKEQFSAGIENQVNIQTTVARIKDIQSQLLSLKTALRQTIYRLAVLLGQNPESFYHHFKQYQPIPQEEGVIAVGLPSHLLQRRPDIRLAERQLASATAQIGVAVGELFPTFSLIGTLGMESSKASKWFSIGSTTWSFGPNFKLPIINFGRLISQVKVQNSKQKQALLTYKRVVINAFKDVENALVAYFNEKETLQLKKEEGKALYLRKNLYKSLFKSGLEDYTLLLQQKIEVVDNQERVVDSQQAGTSNLISLYKALGGGW